MYVDRQLSELLTKMLKMTIYGHLLFELNVILGGSPFNTEMVLDYM